MTLHRFSLAAKAFSELGPRQLWEYARYRGSLRLGFLRWQTSSSPPSLTTDQLQHLPAPILCLPERSQILNLLGDQGIARLRNTANEIISGKVRLFGGESIPLQLETHLPLVHWTEYELGKVNAPKFDYKQIWEPGRFGWGISLARAYHLTGDEQYADIFWSNTEKFLQANPAYFGPHWVSAQEVALRLIALAFCYQAFRSSVHTTSARSAELSGAIATHAARIPPSLSYALSQKNNHLINEAAGLYTAGLLLPAYPQARKWRNTGWHWLNQAFQAQIAADGTYIQHSANYHRLILHTGLWVSALSRTTRQPLPEATLQRLAAATRWLLALLDRSSGGVPNLGPNDGALLFPLSDCPFEDYRPALQAAGAAFLGIAPLEAGMWDELRFWLSEDLDNPATDPPKVVVPATTPDQPPYRLDNPSNASWAYFRVASINSRPGHADQLHLDLWWRGNNLAQDPGTYLYNDPPPWDNALARSGVHNTITVDGQDQMTLAGRFLWLDWAQAKLVEHDGRVSSDWERLTASHDGYRHLGLVHQRSVTCYRNGRCLIEDSVLPLADGSNNDPSHRARLHWLLPDWPWEIDTGAGQIQLTLSSHAGTPQLTIRSSADGSPSDWMSMSLVRAGELLAGTGPVEHTRGWVSYTYAHKKPALSLAVEIAGLLPLIFTSEWMLP